MVPTPQRWGRSLAVGLVGLAGCQWILPFGTPRLDEGSASDLVGERRIAEASAPVDGTRRELGKKDVEPRDAKPNEARPKDAGLKEAAPKDAGLKEATPAADGGSQPCASNASPITSPSGWAASMRLCMRSTKVNQCLAELACGAGWHLCSASEYLLYGGDKEGPGSLAWIKGCVRTGGLPFAPTNGLCSTICSPPAPIANANNSWPCGPGSGVGSPSSNIGLITSSLCHRVGVNDKTTEGFWSPLQVYLTESAAVCCK